MEQTKDFLLIVWLVSSRFFAPSRIRVASASALPPTPTAMVVPGGGDAAGLQQGVAATGGELAYALQLRLGFIGRAAVAGLGLSAPEGRILTEQQGTDPRRTDDLLAIHDAEHVLHGIGVELAAGREADFATGIEAGAVEVEVSTGLEQDVPGVDPVVAARRLCSECSTVVVFLLSQLPVFVTLVVWSEVVLSRLGQAQGVTGHDTHLAR